jgi:alpha/beta superfamily hydrolase
VRYRALAKSLENKGYAITPVNPNWYRPLSEQVFPVEKDDIVFGFSFGAVIAYLIAKKYPCRKVIFASMSPIHEFSFASLVKDYREHMSKELAVEITTDIKKIKILLKDLKVPFVTLAGKREMVPANIIVPYSGHNITPSYIKSIQNIV